MGLDKFMGMDKKKSKKKMTPTVEKKTDNKVDQSEERDEKISLKLDKGKNKAQVKAKPKNESAKNLSFKFIVMSFKCTKCKYKKQLKKPQSFVPKDSDLSCPKCGEKLKITKK